MSESFACPICDHTFQAARVPGKDVICPTCRSVVAVATGDAAPVVSVPAAAAPVSAAPSAAPDDLIRFTCPHCQKKLKFAASAAGRTTTCPRCGRRVEVRPATEPAAPASAAPPAMARAVATPAAPATPDGAVPSAGRRLFKRWPKPVLFGLFGAVGGLVSAIVLGELLWYALSPATFHEEGPRVRLAVADAMRIYAGGVNRLRTHIARHGFEGAVVVEASSLPNGITIKPLTIASGTDEGDVEVAVARHVTPKDYAIPFQGAVPTPPWRCRIMPRCPCKSSHRRQG